MLGLCLLYGVQSQASTYYQLQLPKQKMPYCDYMPFDYVEKNIVKTALNNRIFVKEAVQITFRRAWWDFKPLTGMAVWSPKGLVAAKKLSDGKYQYDLKPLKSGEFYELRGKLKYPVKGGLQICVNTLSH